MKLFLFLLLSAMAIAAVAPADDAPIVSTVTITLQLTQEQLDALTDYASTWNGANGTSTIADRVNADVIQPWVKTKTDAAYDAAVKALGEAAKGLSYAERNAIIQQVQDALQK